MQYRLERPIINGKRSRRWYVVWTEGKRTRRQTTWSDDLGVAEAFLAKFNAAASAPPDTFNMSQLFEAYADEREQSGIRSPDTLRYHLKAPDRHFGGLHPKDINREIVRDAIYQWRDDGKSDSTINKRLRMVRASLSWAVKEEWIERAPHIEAPSQAPPRTRYLTRDEFQRLFAEAHEPHLRTFLALAIYTGMRMSAILELEWRHIQGRMIIPEGGHQNKRRPPVPINTPLALALSVAAHLRDCDHVVSYQGKNITSIKTTFYNAVERAELKDVRIHDLRRTCASWLAQAGEPMEKIAAYIGDELRTVEKHYAHLSPEHLSSAASALE
ncbi:MAG: tyrosine-type recombinase/integrase [Pseudomonadota bacterium]